MKIFHAYHIYVDGNWIKPWTEHVQALKHGLGDNLNGFYVGLVGSPTNRHKARQIVETSGAKVAIEDSTGFE